MSIFTSIVSGGMSGAILVWLLKSWISVRLKQSIQHEYAERLEIYKTELNSKIESIRHDNQVSQLRTSLFFDHQRNAFALILTEITKLNDEWIKGFDADVGLYEPVPSKGYRNLVNSLSEHQLFLDSECQLAISLIMNAYSSSFPFDDGSGAPPHQSDSSPKVAYIEYLQPRLASIFRNKIGIQSDPSHLKDLAVLAAIELVNNHHFLEIGIPPKGALSTRKVKSASDKVIIGRQNVGELVELLRVFDDYLDRDGSWLPETQFEVSQCLSILNSLQNTTIRDDPLRNEN